MKVLGWVLGLLMLATSAGADVSLTVYSEPTQGGRGGQGFAVVRDRRRMEIPTNRGEVSFSEVSSRIDRTSVSFRSLDDPEGTRVLEQDFLYDLVSPEKLLERYLDREIGLVTTEGSEVRGRLLSAAGGRYTIEVAESASPIQVFAPDAVRRVLYPELPGGLITRPTLRWLVDSRRGGTQDVEVTYQSAGLSWRSDYALLLEPGARPAGASVPTAMSMDLSAWVTITNNSGATYPDAELKLLAGEVHRVAPAAAPAPRRASFSRAEIEGNIVDAGFREEGLFEYHLYTLGRRTTLTENATKQVELLAPVLSVPCVRYLVHRVGDGNFWYGGSPNTDRDFGRATTTRKPEIYVEFRNDTVSHLGIPLPAGLVRMYQRGRDGAPEFLGEDRIAHTPRDERVRLKVGQAFDVVVERKQADYRASSGDKWVRETIEIEVRNQKDEAVEIRLIEPLYRWSNWRIEGASDPFDKTDAQTAEFRISIPAHETKTVRYTAHYWWG